LHKTCPALVEGYPFIVFVTSHSKAQHSTINKEYDLNEVGFSLTLKRGKFALLPEGTRLSRPCSLN